MATTLQQQDPLSSSSGTTGTTSGRSYESGGSGGGVGSGIGSVYDAPYGIHKHARMGDANGVMACLLRHDDIDVFKNGVKLPFFLFITDLSFPYNSVLSQPRVPIFPHFFYNINFIVFSLQIFVDALHIACRLNNYDIVRLLLSHGASTTIKNSAQKTPLDVSSKQFNERVNALIIEIQSDVTKNKEGIVVATPAARPVQEVSSPSLSQESYSPIIAPQTPPPVASPNPSPQPEFDSSRSFTSDECMNKKTDKHTDPEGTGMIPKVEKSGGATTPTIADSPRDSPMGMERNRAASAIGTSGGLWDMKMYKPIDSFPEFEDPTYAPAKIEETKKQQPSQAPQPVQPVQPVTQKALLTQPSTFFKKFFGGAMTDKRDTPSSPTIQPQPTPQLPPPSQAVQTPPVQWAATTLPSTPSPQFPLPPKPVHHAPVLGVNRARTFPQKPLPQNPPLSPIDTETTHERSHAQPPPTPVAAQPIPDNLPTTQPALSNEVSTQEPHVDTTAMPVPTDPKAAMPLQADTHATPATQEVPTLPRTTEQISPTVAPSPSPVQVPDAPPVQPALTQVLEATITDATPPQVPRVAIPTDDPSALSPTLPQLPPPPLPQLPIPPLTLDIALLPPPPPVPTGLVQPLGVAPTPQGLQQPGHTPTQMAQSPSPVLHHHGVQRNVPLPPGWIERKDPKTGAFYFVNTVTKTSQWARPTAPASKPSIPLPPTPVQRHQPQEDSQNHHLASSETSTLDEIQQKLELLKQTELLLQQKQEELARKERELEARKNLEAIRSAQPNWQINFSDLVLQEKIGEGGYGEVYKGTWQGTVVAIKTLKGFESSLKEIASFTKEVSILRTLHHPNLVLFLGACTAPKLLVPTPPRRQILALDMARGLAYLHNCHPPIIHRDIKSLNILLDEKAEHAKICDVGLARVFDDDTASLMTNAVGTFCWMPPEMMKGEKYNEKADVYSYALVVTEMITGKLPFSGLAPAQITLKVAVSQERPPLPTSLNHQWRELLHDVDRAKIIHPILLSFIPTLCVRE
ncbi:protein kinase [Pelomyxa schiedti]|nr:protein kinase [Pelomyxa schiedti]